MQSGGILETLSSLDDQRKKKHCEFLHRILLKGGNLTGKNALSNLKKDSKSLLHIRKLSIYFLDEIIGDYLHDQILKIAASFRRHPQSDLNELIVYYRDLFGYLQITKPEKVSSSHLDWVQDYVDLAKEVNIGVKK